MNVLAQYPVLNCSYGKSILLTPTDVITASRGQSQVSLMDKILETYLAKFSQLVVLNKNQLNYLPVSKAHVSIKLTAFLTPSLGFIPNFSKSVTTLPDL